MNNGALAIPRRRPHVLPAAPDLRGLRVAEDHTTLERPTIAVIVARYLEWMSGNAAKHTVRTYTDALRHFGEFLAVSGINAFEETAEVLPATILEEWIGWCRKRPMHRTGRPLGPASVQTYFYAVSGCFKWAARRKLLPERFRWAEMFANATETLGKLYWRLARMVSRGASPRNRAGESSRATRSWPAFRPRRTASATRWPAPC